MGPILLLNDRMHAAFKAHCFHQMLPLEMPAKLARHGFVGAHCTPMGFLNNSLHHNSFAYLASTLFTHFAVGKEFLKKTYGAGENNLTKRKKTVDSVSSAFRC